MVDRTDDHLLEFVKGDGILALNKSRRAQQDENGFDAGRGCLLNAMGVVPIHVDVVVDIDVVGSRVRERG